MDEEQFEVVCKVFTQTMSSVLFMYLSNYYISFGPNFGDLEHKHFIEQKLFIYSFLHL